MNYAFAATIGAVTGLRCLSGPAVIATAARTRRLNVKRTPLAWLGSSKALPIASALAIGEMIADKLPFIPDRVKPGPLAGRAITGALCGYVVFRAGGGNRQAIPGALIGSAAALAAAWVGYQYRRKSPLPGIVSALIEDAVAAGAGALVIRKLCA
jgi:uncharacterized membrane protein